MARWTLLFSAHVGEHVERNVSLATFADARLRRPVGLTALRRTDVFAFEPGTASWKHAPTPERCPRQEPLGRNRPPAFTLCYKVSGPSALPPRFGPVDPRERDEMIENGQNKADFSGVCRCQITTYDKVGKMIPGLFLRPCRTTPWSPANGATGSARCMRRSAHAGSEGRSGRSSHRAGPRGSRRCSARSSAAGPCAGYPRE